MARNNGPVTQPRRWPEPLQGQGVAQPRHDQNGYDHTGHAGYDHTGQARPGPSGYPPQHGVPQPAPQHPGYAQGGYAPAWPQDPHAGHDPHAAAHQQPYYYPEDQGYAQSHAHQSQHHGGYDTGHADAYSQPTLHPAPAHGYAEQAATPQPQAYAPQFEPYHPAPERTAPPTRDPHAMQQAETVYRPPAPRAPVPTPAYDPYAQPEPQLRGPAYDDAATGWHDAQSAHDPYHQQQMQGWQQQAATPYDQGYAAPPAYADSYAGYGSEHAAANAPHAYGYGHQQEPEFGSPAAYAPPAAANQHGLEHDYDPDEVTYEDDDAPSGKGRLLKVAAALVLAIGVGGGLAYGYKTFIAGSGSDKPPVVRTAQSPSKIKPEDPGGKKFAHTDSKILGRLSDSGDKPAPPPGTGAAASDSDPNGTRKVSTMVIGRDGSVVDSAATSAPPPAAPPQAVTPVPGMTIVDGFGGRRPVVSGQPASSAAAMTATAPVAAPPAPAAARPAPSSPSKPVVISRAAPEAEPAAAEAAPSRQAAAPVKPQRVARAAPEPAASAPAAAPAGRATAAGYVAVLASIPASGSSRMEALKQFADLQQKYAGQLANKTPDVQDANLGTKGTYSRLIVGPPGSRQQASQLCSDLKSAGYGSCWVKAY